MTPEQELRSLIDDRKALLLDEIRTLPTKSKREIYLSILERAVQEIVIDKNLGRIEL